MLAVLFNYFPSSLLLELYAEDIANEYKELYQKNRNSLLAIPSRR